MREWAPRQLNTRTLQVVFLEKKSSLRGTLIILKVWMSDSVSRSSSLRSYEHDMVEQPLKTTWGVCRIPSKMLKSRLRGGSRGRVQGMRTSPWDDLPLSNTTGILQKKSLVYWCQLRYSLVVHSLQRKILDPPLRLMYLSVCKFLLDMIGVS